MSNVCFTGNLRNFYCFVSRIIELFGTISTASSILGCLIGGFAERKLRAHSPSAGLSFSGFCMTISAVISFMTMVFIQYLDVVTLFSLNFVAHVLGNCMWAIMGQVFLVSTTLCVDEHIKMNVSNVRES